MPAIIPIPAFTDNYNALLRAGRECRDDRLTVSRVTPTIAAAFRAHTIARVAP
jgi:hypothetical protein